MKVQRGAAKLLFCLLALMLAGCGAHRHPQPTAVPTQEGVASWYGARSRGSRTASGERFDPEELTAAHRTLPLGSHVRVTNLDNGRAVCVRINDRGPFVRGRSVDLSRAAAERLGMVHRGTARVRIEVLDAPEHGWVGDARYRRPPSRRARRRRPVPA